MSKRDRRVAARTKATTPPATPDAPLPAELGEPPDDAQHARDAPASTASATQMEPDDGAAPLAKVIPLGIFDPFTEADKRW